MRTFIFFILLFATICLKAQNEISWNPAMNVVSSSSGNNHPRIVTNASGDPLMIWWHASRVMYSRWNGSGFENPRILNPVSMNVAGASWMGPDIAAHGDTIYVVFKETPEDAGHVWCIHSYDGGEIFSDPVQVDFISDSLSRFPTVTTDATGNPVIGFMKFDAGFSRARWVVVNSKDFGISFSPDVLASGWSSPTSVVCDCCPGSVIASDDNVVMLYRDNNSNIRDTWAALSVDGGQSFSLGINVDQHNWMISACPSSGPDAVVIGDTLYSTFMNGAGGKSRVYINQTSLADFTGTQGKLLTGTIPGVSQQNFPRISASGKALGVVWKQSANGNDQCVISFTSSISSGKPSVYDTVSTSGVNNSDVVIWNGNIYVVWEDYNSGTLKFRSGTYIIPDEEEGVGFLDSNYVWNEYHRYYPSGSISFKYTIDSNPTLISGKPYYAVLRSEEEQSQNWGIEAYIRYENNIVYKPGSPEKVLYNFNLMVGDTFSSNLEMVVDSIDTIFLLTGEERKHWKLRCIYDEPKEEFYIEWVEGIGNIDGLFSAYNVHSTCVADAGESYITCIFRNDTLIYDDPDIDGCWILPVSTNETYVESLQIIPNPTLDYFTISGLKQEIKSVQLYNSMGILVAEDNKNWMDVGFLTPGYYYTLIILNDNHVFLKSLVKM